MRPEHTLRRITNLIVRNCDPEVVLLFGSYAKEQDNVDSDLDILVIGNFREARSLRGQEIQQLLLRYPIRIDLHFMTPEEIEAELEKPYDFIHSILTSSIIMYKKANEIIDKNKRIE